MIWMSLALSAELMTCWRQNCLAISLSVLLAPLSPADDDAIKKAGGTVRQLGGGKAVEFHLGARDLDDAALACVAGRTDIVSLNLRDTKITSAGTIHLKGLSGLRRLHLERTAIDDRAMQNIAQLTKLEYLNLYSTKVSDASVAQLKKLTKLKQLYLWQTGITETGCRRLQAASQDLKIVRGVDLDKIAAEAEKKANASKEPLVELKWHPVSAQDPLRSKSGTFTTVTIVNQRDEPVKLYWVQYGGGLKFYADIAAGATLERNTFSDATWVITDAEERQLGYFISILKPSRIAIPKK